MFTQLEMFSIHTFDKVVGPVCGPILDKNQRIKFTLLAWGLERSPGAIREHFEFMLDLFLSYFHEVLRYGRFHKQGDH